MKLNRKEARQMRELAIQIVADGGTFEEASEKTGYGTNYVRQICTKAGVHKTVKQVSKEKKAKCIELALEGRSVEEIVHAIGVHSPSYVYSVLKPLGIKIQTKELTRERMRKCKAEGRTMAEVAEIFGVSKQTVQLACKGIAPQKPCVIISEEQREALRNDIKTVESIIAERADGFEYAGNYTGSNGTADLRCKKCGNVFTRSWVAVRHGKVECKICKGAEIKKRQEQREREQVREQASKEAEIQEAKERKHRERVLRYISRLHFCPVCGMPTDRPVYCSDKCSRKATSHRHDVGRRLKIRTAMVDTDISLDGLFRRDGGMCAICGEPCDYCDHEERDGFFIAGENYPSVDHIVPLAKGGLHSWDNVQLAHFKCNTLKGARV